jgi:hypothetical protein
MQVQKRYKGINPELVYDEIGDIVSRHGGTVVKEKSFKETPVGGGLRGTLLASFPVESKKGGFWGESRITEDKEAISSRIVGMTDGITSVIIKLDEAIVPRATISEMLSDLEFMAGPYEWAEKTRKE